MIRIDLTEKERELLFSILEEAYQETRQEIGRTKSYRYKLELHEKNDLLKGILERLSERETIDAALE